MTPEEREEEQRVRASVEAMAEGIPADSSLLVLAANLLVTMGDRSIDQKLLLMTTTCVAALKIIAEQKEFIARMSI
jgi:hypothetical protein